MPCVDADQLESIATNILVNAGASNDEASTVARHLVLANLSGHDSHGVIRLPQYVDEIQRGIISPGASLNVLKNWPTGATMDAGGSFGQVACHQAMLQVLEKASQHGVAAVTLLKCGHSGRIGTYGELAASRRMIGVIANNAGGNGQWVAPFGGRSGRLATNPLCIAVPGPGEFPLVLDISTCVAPEGKIRHYHQSEQQTPNGWLINADGLPTNNPALLYQEPRGALQPLGDEAGYKGYGLAVMIDILAGALSGAGCCRADTSLAKGRGLFMMAIDIEVFTTHKLFEESVTLLAEHIHRTPTRPGYDAVLLPGEFEFRNRQHRSLNGIEISSGTWKAIAELCPP